MLPRGSLLQLPVTPEPGAIGRPRFSLALAPANPLPCAPAPKPERHVAKRAPSSERAPSSYGRYGPEQLLLMPPATPAAQHGVYHERDGGGAAPAPAPVAGDVGAGWAEPLLAEASVRRRPPSNTPSTSLRLPAARS